MFLPRFLGVFCLLFNLYASQDSALQQIRARGELRVGMAASDDPPFSVTDNKGHQFGIDIDLSKSLAKHLNVKLKIIKFKNLDELVTHLLKGKVDLCISNLSITLERAQKANFSHPYVEVKKAILLNNKTFSQLKEKEEESIESFFMKGHKLGVIRGSSYEEFAHNYFPKANLVLYDEWEPLVDDLDKGVIAAGFADELYVKRIVLFRPQGSLRYQAVVLKLPTDKVGIMVPKFHQEFLNWINTFLELRFKRLNFNDLLEFYKKNIFNKVDSKWI